MSASTDFDNVSAQVVANAQAPAAVTSDGISVTNPNIRDLLATTKDLGANIAMQSARRGVIFNKLCPPGAP